MKTLQYCSFCYQKTEHRLVQRNILRRNVYECSACKGRTVECRLCKAMAKGGEYWDDEFCAVHSGVIADFATLDAKLTNITDWRKITERAGVNMMRVGKVAGGATAVALVATGVGAVAAPALASAAGSVGLLGAAGTGTAINTLSGAALSSASLAAIGGGTVAAGTTIIAVSAGSLGAIGGGVVVNRFAGDVEGFDIKLCHSGKRSEPRVIVINGFLTEKESSISQWRPALNKRFKNQHWYEVNWESKRLRDMGKVIAGGVGKSAFKKGLEQAAKQATKQASKIVLPLSVLVDVIGLSANPWSVALSKAKKTAHMLSALISKTDHDYVLVGHSLGARVIAYILQDLINAGQEPQIKEVHLLGGAVENTTDFWKIAQKACSGKIYNYHSYKDDVLKYMYTIGTLFRDDPIGRTPILDVPNVENIDVTNAVSGHTHYKEAFDRFIK